MMTLKAGHWQKAVTVMATKDDRPQEKQYKVSLAVKPAITISIILICIAIPVAVWYATNGSYVSQNAKLTLEINKLNKQIDEKAGDVDNMTNVDISNLDLGYDITRVDSDTAAFDSFIHSLFPITDKASFDNGKEKSYKYFVNGKDDPVFKKNGLIGSLGSATDSNGNVYDALSANDIKLTASIKDKNTDVYFQGKLDNSNYKYTTLVTEAVSVRGTTRITVPTFFTYEMTADHKIVNLDAYTCTKL